MFRKRLLPLILAACALSACDLHDSKSNDAFVRLELPLPPREISLVDSGPELPSVLANIDKEWKEDSKSPEVPDEDVISVKPPTLAEMLARAGLERTMHNVRYDGSYLKIAYPMGDVPENIGVCTDVVIRSFRKLGIDLQQLVHEDIRKNFSRYPSRKRWGLRKPDTNIDHRRVYNLQAYNLQAFFERRGTDLPITLDPENYLPGDLVTWQINPKMPHIGIVLEMVSREDPRRPLIVHNIGNGPVIDDMLFDFKITGHYRYFPEHKKKL